MSAAKGPGMRCPHCRSRCDIRSSRVLTPVYREVTYACRNFNCGHVFVCNLEAVRTLSPSAIPDPEVQLPLSAHVRRDMLVHQLRQPATEDAHEPA